MSHGTHFPSWQQTNRTLASLLSYLNTHIASSKSPRLATFDCDGTLLTEKPTFPETFLSYYALCHESQWRKHDSLRNLPKIHKGPHFQHICQSDVRRAANDLKYPEEVNELLLTTFNGWSQEEFETFARHFVRDVPGCYLRDEWMPATKMLYKPMLELIRYLIREWDFEVYVISASQQSVVRVIMEAVFDCVEDSEERRKLESKLHVIGSTVKCNVVIHLDSKSEITGEPSADQGSSLGSRSQHSSSIKETIPNHPSKETIVLHDMPHRKSPHKTTNTVPVQIVRTSEFDTQVYHEVKIQELYKMTPHLPCISFGNNANDLETFYYTMQERSDPVASFCAFVHHDDSEREVEYDVLTDTALGAEAKRWGWKIISMRDEWKDVF